MENNKNNETFKEICRLKKSPPVDIEFQDLSYLIKGGGKCNVFVTKIILNTVP